MKDLVSKISLYDIVSMIIPGGAIFLYFSLLLGNEWQFDSFKIDTALAWMIALVISYLLGLINHVCTAFAWQRLKFRNNPQMILAAKVGIYLYPQGCCCLVGIFSIIIFLVVVVEYFRLGWDFDNLLVFLPFAIYAVMTVLEIFRNNRQVVNNKINIQSRNLLDCYYRAYYYVVRNRYDNDILIMEGQVAFMQNMILPALFFFCILDDSMNLGFKHICIVRCLIAIGVILLIPAIYMRQYKIYRCVWEDYENLKETEK